MDWSSTNVLGVGLGACVYLWSAHTSKVTKLCDLSDFGGTDSITSISWVQRVSSRRRIDLLLTCEAKSMTHKTHRDLISR